MGCPIDTVLMESIKNTRKTPRRAITEPLSTPALMPTKELVRLPIHKKINTRDKRSPDGVFIQKVKWFSMHGVYIKKSMQ